MSRNYFRECNRVIGDMATATDYRSMMDPPLVDLSDAFKAPSDTDSKEPIIEHDRATPVYEHPQSPIEGNGLGGSSKVELYHGPFSSCDCKKCMEAAKVEIEKRFSNETLTTKYIEKLEGLVNSLQIELDGSKSSDFYDLPPVLPYSPPQKIIQHPTMGFLEGDRVGPRKVGGPKLAISRIKKVTNQFGNEENLRDYEPGPGDASMKMVESKEILTVYRHFSNKMEPWMTSVEIFSPPFVKVLRQVAEYDLDIILNNEVMRLTEPLMVLFHYRKLLTQYLQDNRTKHTDMLTRESIDHTKFILDYMRDEIEDASRTLDDLESAHPSGLITYPDIWLLYPPGTVGYTTENGEHEAFIVDSVHGMAKQQRSRSGKQHYGRLELICWSINYDGEIFGREWTTHIIPPFSGTKEISSLDFVPEKFLPNANTVKESLKARGRAFWDLQGQNYHEYTGEIWSQRMSEDSIRVMVDHLTYQRRMNWPIVIDKKRGPSGALSKNWRDNKFTLNGRSYDTYGDDGRSRRKRGPPPPPRVPPQFDNDRAYNPDGDFDDEQYQQPYKRYKVDRPALRGDSKFNRYNSLDPASKPDDLTLLLCPQHVHGYCLRDKIWKSLNVSQLKPVTFRKNAWQRLVLDDQYKDIVQAMVSSYVDKTAKLDDLIAGKGAGLVALLHGPPGTGKTLTAECVAESFEKPLYQVTCGDIGTSPERVEEKLEEIFDYSVTWGAILLLDEADIFLQDRRFNDLRRNALVSIFLRTLEYFNGILFLTTNRVGTFDQAFQSRIHVTLGLPQLDRARRTEVWSIFIQDLCNRSLITPAESDALEALVANKWSREPLNGRQIRNSIRTALLVAEKKQETVGEKHFETVLKIGREFTGYMSALQDGDEATVAESQGKRLADLAGFQEVEME